jgi:hypothetical protein
MLRRQLGWGEKQKRKPVLQNLARTPAMITRVLVSPTGPTTTGNSGRLFMGLW